MQTGAEVFVEGLRNLGYESLVLSGKPDHLVITYTVESGKFSGNSYRLGFVVPPSFPVNPPGGIHVAALVHPFRSDGTHPTGGIHQQQALGFQQALGGAWQYWSRPPLNWNTGKKTVEAYMCHVWCLWDSQ